MIWIPFKPGATFSLAMQYTVNGAPSSIAGKTIASQVKTEALAPVADLVVSVVDVDAGLFSVSCASVDTTTWPNARLLTDVRVLHADGRVALSKTFGIDAEARVTDG